MTKPQLQVGQLWRRRDGGLARIASKKPSDDGFTVDFLPGPGEEKEHDPTWFLGWNYGPNGKCYGVSQYDLVQLLDGPGAPPFAAGQVWRRRDGGEAKILRPYPSSSRAWAVKLPGVDRPLLSGAGWYYNADGTCGGSYTQYDLISLISEAPAKDPTPQRPPLAVGQRWRRADGVEAVVESEHTAADVSGANRFLVRCDNDLRLWYGADGRGNIHGSHPEFELVELVSEAAAPTPTPRPIDKIAVANGNIVALAEDGTLWVLRDISKLGTWHQLPALPGVDND